MDKPKAKHFVLVHGACLGAWTWYKVVTLLESNGHKVTALDMAASGINPKSAAEVHSAADYSEPLMEFMADLAPDEKVILVGHSLGGVCISLAMEQFPHKISVAVFLSAVMPVPGVNMDALFEKYKRPPEFYMDCKLEFGEGEDRPPTTVLFGPIYLATKLCQLSPAEDISLSMLLIRPLPNSISESYSELVSKEKYGSVTRVYLKPANDLLIIEPIETFTLQIFPPAELKIISNSDHMAMFSNPVELSADLHEISQNYI